MPPSTLKAEVVENNDLGARSLKELDVNNLEPVHYTEEDIIININDSTELVGCYEHPIPVLSLLLSVWEIDDNLCVVCGLFKKGKELLSCTRCDWGWPIFYYYVGSDLLYEVSL